MARTKNTTKATRSNAKNCKNQVAGISEKSTVSYDSSNNNANEEFQVVDLPEQLPSLLTDVQTTVNALNLMQSGNILYCFVFIKNTFLFILFIFSWKFFRAKLQ